MKLLELVNKYYFHDCGLNAIHYDSEQQRVEIIMDFCNCVQDYYVKGMRDVIAVKLIFSNVSHFSCDGLEQIDWGDEILNGELIRDKSKVPIIDNSGNNGIHFFVARRPEIGCSCNLEIFAQDVEFIDLESKIED